MPPVCADDSGQRDIYPGRLRAHTGHALPIERQIDHFVLHNCATETREILVAKVEEIEKIPLRQ